MDLLEREPFLRVLASEAASARQGDGRLVLISGESGIGKTALVEAFHEADSRGRSRPDLASTGPVAVGGLRRAADTPSAGPAV